MKRTKALGLIAATLWAIPAAAPAADASAIMKKVFDAKAPKTTKATMEMTLEGASGSKQSREMRMERSGKNRQLVWFVAPNDLRGTAFLSIKEGKEENMWLYLPAFKQTQRIAGGKKRDSFMGSDFTYEDMAERELDDYTYTYVKGVKLDGKNTHVIDGKPVDADSTYSNVRFYIDAQLSEMTKAEMSGPTGELVKVMTNRETKTISGYRLPTEINMKDVTRDHQTTIKMGEITMDGDVPENHFSTNYLSRVR